MHFDSRLFSFYPFIKQLTMYSFLLLVRFILNSQNRLQFKSQKFYWNSYQIQLFLLLLVIIILFMIIDYKDFIYCQHFKDFMLFADFCQLTLLSACIYLQGYKNDMSSATFFGLSVMLLLFLLLISQIPKARQSTYVFQKNIHALSNESQDALLEYFQQFRKILMNRSSYQNQQAFNSQLTRYFYFHIENCNINNCEIQKLNNNKNCEAFTKKYDAIKDLMLSQLKFYSTKKEKIAKYMFFVMDPNSFQHKDLLKDLSCWYIRREYHKICKQLQNNQQNSYQDPKNRFFFQTDTISEKNKKSIQNYLENGKKFYQKLLAQEELNLDLIFQSGNQMINSLQDLKKYEHYFKKLNTNSKFLLSNFKSRIIQQNSLLFDVQINKILQNRQQKDQNKNSLIKDLNLKQINEKFPLLKIQNDDNFQMKIIQSNSNWSKQLYYSKEETYQKSIFDFLPIQFAKIFKKQLRIVLESDTKFIKGQFQIFLKNKMGYCVVFHGKIYEQSKNIFYFSLQPRHLLMSFIILSQTQIQQRESQVKKQLTIIGLSQMSTFSGFNVQNESKKLTTEFQQKITAKIEQSQKQLGKFNYFEPLIMEIFQEQKFENYNQKDIIFLETVQIQDQKYHIIQINNEAYDASMKESLHKMNKFPNIQSQLNVVELSQNNCILSTFKFFYHTNGKIYRFQQDQECIKKYFTQRCQNQQNETRNFIKGKLDQDILQMCLIKNTLDYKQNQQEETTFRPILQISQQRQPQNQQISLIDRKIYEESQKIKNQIAPVWLKQVRIVIVLIFVVLFGVRATDIYLNQARNITNINQMAIFHSLTLIEQGYQNIAIKLLSSKYYSANKVYNPSLINTALSNIKKNALILYQLCPQIEAMLSQKQFQTSQDIFLINLNNFTKFAQTSSISLFNQTVMISQLIYQMNDYFHKVQNILVVNKFKQTKKQYFDVLISLNSIFSIFVIGFFAYFCYMINYLKDQETKILKVFSKLRESVFQKELLKIQLFQDYLYLGKNIFQEQDLEYLFKINHKIPKNDSNYNKIGYKRIFNKKIAKYFMIVLVLVWSIASIGICIDEYQFVNQFQGVKSEVQIRKSHLSQIGTNFNFLWMTLNLFPNNRTKIQQYYGQMFLNDLAFRDLSFKYCNFYFSEEFKSYYVQIWSGNLCQFLNDSSHADCLTFQNGAMRHGLDQITAYLSRKYRILIQNAYNQTVFKSLKVTSDISDMVVRYLSKLYYSNNVRFILEYYRICAASLSSLRVQQGIQVGLLLFLLLFYYFLSSRQKRIKNLQKMFELIPFQELSKEDIFIKYFEQKNMQIYRNNTQAV